jgi:hypothetical protein
MMDKVKEKILLYQFAAIPGLGQFFNGQYKKGLVMFISALVLAAAFGIAYVHENTGLAAVFGAILLALIGYSFYDAFCIGGEMSEGEKWAINDRLEKEAKKQVGYDPDRVQTPLTEGGFKRKIKGRPEFKPFKPLPDEEQKPGDTENDNSGRK